jgi:polyhydroxyalkanoate synthesis regulator protein
MGKQNMVMFERAMRMFSPFATAENRAQEGDQPRPRATDGERALEEMQRQLEELQRQLVTITKPKKD